MTNTTDQKALVLIISENDLYPASVLSDAKQLLIKTKSVNQALGICREKIFNARKGIKSPLSSKEDTLDLIDSEDHWTEVLYCIEDTIAAFEKSCQEGKE